MVIEHTAKPTLTPVELNHGNTLRFVLRNGTPWEMRLLSTSAKVTARATVIASRMAAEMVAQAHGSLPVKEALGDLQRIFDHQKDLLGCKVTRPVSRGRSDCI